MIVFLVFGALLISGSSATFFQQLGQVMHPLLNLLGLPIQPVRCGLAPGRCGPTPLRCGLCPARDCRTIPAVVLGFCCGCALPIDRVPIVCPLNLVCPPAGPRLCRDYNYLLECCC